MSRHYKVYQESKAGGGGWDDSLTGPIVAGRLDETTASTTDDSGALKYGRCC